MKAKHIIQVDIDPSQPVSELEQVITVVINTRPGEQKHILEALQRSIGKTLTSLEPKTEEDS